MEPLYGLPARRLPARRAGGGLNAGLERRHPVTNSQTNPVWLAVRRRQLRLRQRLHVIDWAPQYRHSRAPQKASWRAVDVKLKGAAVASVQRPARAGVRAVHISRLKRAIEEDRTVRPARLQLRLRQRANFNNTRLSNVATWR